MTPKEKKLTNSAIDSACLREACSERDATGGQRSGRDLFGGQPGRFRNAFCRRLSISRGDLKNPSDYARPELVRFWRSSPIALHPKRQGFFPARSCARQSRGFADCPQFLRRHPRQNRKIGRGFSKRRWTAIFPDMTFDLFPMIGIVRESVENLGQPDVRKMLAGLFGRAAPLPQFHDSPDRGAGAFDDRFASQNFGVLNDMGMFRRHNHEFMVTDDMKNVNDDVDYFDKKA